MLTHSELMLYIGREYNENVKSEIEYKCTPYTIMICDIEYFYLEHYINNTIRCVVDDGKIIQLCFH